MAFDSQRWPAGRLELDLGAHSLFRDDDLELIELLLERAVRAAEREAFVIERERLIAELQAASAAKSDFLAAMSHELRTPLNAIIGFSELLTEGGEEAADPATVQTYAEHIHGSGLHLLELVNDVLDLARVEAGRLDLKPVRFELDDLVRQTVATLQPLADQKQLAVVARRSPRRRSRPTRPRCARSSLNLLSNAIKFTDPGGEIRISLARGRSRARPAHGRRQRASASGPRTSTASSRRSTRATATGSGPTTRAPASGLALTRQLVEAHGGTITVRSEVGDGQRVHRPAAAEPRRARPTPSRRRPSLDGQADACS